MLDFHNRITEAGLTPNGYFAVLFHLLGVKTKTLIETTVEFRRLKKAGFLTEHLAPTQLLMDTGLFNDLELIVDDDRDERAFEVKIGMFLAKFPAKLPDGRYARCTVRIAKPQFLEFFKHYKYDWETIYQAADNYIETYAKKDFMYMRNAANFIWKDGDSQLALECEELTKKETEVKSPWDFDI
jgi:hypothetical protein